MLLYAGSWPFESHHTGFFLKGIQCLVLLSGGYQHWLSAPVIHTYRLLRSLLRLSRDILR